MHRMKIEVVTSMRGARETGLTPQLGDLLSAGVGRIRSKLASAVHVTLCCLAGCLIQIDQDRAKLTIMSRRSDPDENIKTHPGVG